MQETQDQQPKQPAKDFKGLYRNVKISVPTLNAVIIGGIVLMVVLLAIGLRSPGYMVDFNSMGGTPVESQKLMYGDKIVPPANPTREGFEFAGWYTDENCHYPWNMETDAIGGPMTLYAMWEEIQ